MTTWQYIRELCKPADRIAICWKMHTEPAFHQRFLSADAAAKDPYQRFLRAMNAQGNNIYIGMNPLRPGSRSRTKADISEVRHVYALIYGTEIAKLAAAGSGLRDSTGFSFSDDITVKRQIVAYHPLQ